jgi:hypothetical protein
VKIQSKIFFFSRDDPIIYGGLREDSYILPRIYWRAKDRMGRIESRYSWRAFSWR